MAVTYDARHKPVFSDDHQFTTLFWLVADGAPSTFADYVFGDRMHSMKLDDLGRARLSAAAAMYIHPDLHWRNATVERVERTLYWGHSVCDTAEILSDLLDLSVTGMTKDLGPDYGRRVDERELSLEERRGIWYPLAEAYPQEAFETLDALRANFPDAVKSDQQRIAKLILDYAASFQEAKSRGRVNRGDGRYQTGLGLILTLFPPILTLVMEELTGSRLKREVNPGDIVKLTFEGEKLVKAEHKWLQLEIGTEQLLPE